MANIFEPKKFEDLVFASANTKSILEDIKNGVLEIGEIKHGIILYGSFGSGKTTAAKIICDMIETTKSGNPMYVDPTYIDCDGTESFLNILNNAEKRRCVMSMNHSDYHYFIFDEADQLSKKSQSKLRMFMQKKRVISIITTNVLLNVDNGVRDRCYQLEWNPPHQSEIIDRVKRVVVEQNLVMPSDDVLYQLTSSSNGSWREILPKLQKYFN